MSEQVPVQKQMTAEEKKRDLYLRQKQLLDTFLEHGAISRAQYDKSLGDLTVKMGFAASTWKARALKFRFVSSMPFVVLVVPPE